VAALATSLPRPGQATIRYRSPKWVMRFVSGSADSTEPSRGVHLAQQPDDAVRRCARAWL